VIRRTWKDPNVTFIAKDSKGITQKQVCFAENKTDLHRYLTQMGYEVVAIEDYDFSEWRVSAEKAKDRLIWQRIKDRWLYFGTQARDRWTRLTAGDIATIDGSKRELVKVVARNEGVTEAIAVEQVDEWSAQVREETPAPGQLLPKTAFSFREEIWQSLKWHLFYLFYGKCAYCESKPLATEGGDVEHYRPKAKVDEDENHPGYYWLAYDERNLLPSCELCNRPGRAKLTHFPVAGVHARDQAHLPSEQPLLLNPYEENVDPFEHLEFNEVGSSQPHNASTRGAVSRDIYDLNRGFLKESRYQIMQGVEIEWNTRVSRYTSIVQAFRDLRVEILRGERAYSAAQLWQLDRLRAKTIRDLGGLQ